MGRRSYMRPEGFAHMLHFVNIKMGGTYGLLENCGGYLTGAIAERMGGVGRLFTFSVTKDIESPNAAKFNVSPGSLQDVWRPVMLQTLFGRPHWQTLMPGGGFYHDHPGNAVDTPAEKPPAPPAAKRTKIEAVDAAEQEAAAAAARAKLEEDEKYRKRRAAAEYQQKRKAKALKQLRALTERVAELRLHGLDGCVAPLLILTGG